MAISEAYLVGGVRTPVGRYGGALSSVRADDLAALALGEAVRRSGVPAEAIEEIVFGAANQAGEDNRNVARMAALLAGLPDSVPGITVNRLCASGMSAITLASQAVRAGDADVVVAGGVESMTRAPWVQAKPQRAWAKPGEALWMWCENWSSVSPTPLRLKRKPTRRPSRSCLANICALKTYCKTMMNSPA